MLNPREADLPALFVVLVVLPIIAYIILGKWNEASEKKKVKITMLAQIAAEEALRAEAMVTADLFPDLPVSPSPKGGAHLCAECFSPATTRCSRCKSVRYCSGKCQIIHWRQGHKQECQLPIAVLYNFTDKRGFIDGARELIGNDTEKHPQESSFLAFTDEPFCQKTDLSSDGYRPGHENSITVKERFFHSAPLGAKNSSVECEKVTNGSKSLLKPNNVEKMYAFNTVTNEDRSSSPVEEKSGLKGNIMYKKPPYTLDSNKSIPRAPSQFQSQATKRKGEVEIDSRSPQHATTSVSERTREGLLNLEMIPEASRKSSKSTKRSLSGLMSSYKKLKVLFPYEDLVKLFQCEVTGIVPRGLLNCGNSCYANVVLQCLTFTKPLMVYLLRQSHSRTCCMKNWCLMCELEQHATMLLDGGGPLSPSNILVNMRSIGCRMGGGNQEDAHEFLRLLVMSMQAVCLEDQGGEKRVDTGLQETTLVQQIFGGRLKSKVKCLRCHQESERYESIMDLTLEIFGWVESLEDALTQFTTPEDLDGENMYRCGRCSTYVKARKQLTLHEVPNILTIVLKRFQTGKYGKINKCVTFPDLLDMIPFVTGSADSPPLYTLYAVIVHLDTLNTSFSGHYVSYVKDIHGTWFRIDDSEVQVVSSSQVMSEGAYMLFYSRCFPRPPRAYVQKSLLQAPPLQNESRHELDSEAAASKHEKSREGRNANAGIYFRSDEMHVEPAGVDFSDTTTSSEWSLFTSSDDSSFTTESTRDSFSAVDHGDSTGLDTISSIFNPFYMPGSSQGNAISCTKSLSSCPQTRFYCEKREFVSDSSAPTRLIWRCT